MRRAIALAIATLVPVPGAAKDLPQQDFSRVMDHVLQVGAARTWACWHDYPLLHGYISYEIEIDGPKGVVTGITLTPENFADLSHTDLHRCVEAGFTGIRIPRFPYGPFGQGGSYQPAEYRPKP